MTEMESITGLTNFKSYFKNTFALLLILLFATSCGGGSGSGSGNEDEGGDGGTPPTSTTLSITVGNVTLSSAATLPRATIVISGDSKKVAKISTNKASTITLSGGLDLSLFEINDVGSHKELAFTVQPDPFNPADSNADGIYEVDINASDDDGQTVTFKAAYKIIIPRSAKDILSGQTFYTNIIDNTYKKVEYTDTAQTTSTYGATGLVADSTKKTNITYDGLSITFDRDNSIKATCQVSETPKINLSCEDEDKSYKISYLSTAPALTIPEEFKLSATPSQIVNRFKYSASRIKSFSIKGNKPIENNKVVISKSSFQGQFSIEVVSQNERSKSDASWLFLADGDYSLETFPGKPGSLFFHKTSYSCIYNHSNNGGVNFTCDDIEINNTKGDNDTEMQVAFCDKSPVNFTDANCNFASLPVLFTD